MDVRAASKPAPDQIPAFRQVFDTAKQGQPTEGFGWYPYDSLSSLEELLSLRPDRFTELFGSIQGRRILDVGCADGAMSFFLESLGFGVVAMDSPVFNFNQMRGVQELKQRLGSQLEIRQVDLERDLLAADEDFGLAVAMGLLYHLRNPITFLQRLARCSSYCFLSTRVLVGDSTANAYLVDSTELGEDETNYWLFTVPGMERLLKRTGWDLEASSQVTVGGDTRYFCWAKSRLKRPWIALAGVHAPEEHGWSWTERRFRLRTTAPAVGLLELHLVLPEAVLAALGPVGLKVAMPDGSKAAHQLERTGAHCLTLGPVAAGVCELEVVLDRALAASAADKRELGLVLEDVRWVAAL